MQTKATIEPAGSPVPGVIPDPVRVHHDPAAQRPPLRRTPASRAWAGMWSALHGDKYMVGAYPPEWQPRAPCAVAAASASLAGGTLSDAATLPRTLVRARSRTGGAPLGATR